MFWTMGWLGELLGYLPNIVPRVRQKIMGFWRWENFCCSVTHRPHLSAAIVIASGVSRSFMSGWAGSLLRNSSLSRMIPSAS